MRSPIGLSHRLDAGALTCRAVIETPAGSRAKFDYDPESGLFELAGVLPAGMAFPLDFGFIPSTKAEDGDPIDVLVMSELGQPLPVGCLVEVRLLGAIEAEQTERDDDGRPRTCRNDRIVARLAESRAFAEVAALDQLGPSFRDELERFFVTYNRLKDKSFTVLGTASPQRAASLIREAST